MKRVMKLLLVLVFTLTCALSVTAFTACGGGNKLSAKEQYTLSAIAGAAYYSQDAGASASSDGIESYSAAPSTTTLEKKAEFDEYFVMFQGYLEKGTLDITASAISEEDLAEAVFYTAGFRTKIVASMPKIGGTGLETYTIYYKETATATGDGYNQNDIIDYDDDEVEVSTTVSGVVVVGTEQYAMTGVRTVETDLEDGEVETTLDMTVAKDLDNYLKVVHEAEDQEFEFAYKIYEGGALTSMTKVEFEIEANDVDIEVFMYDGTTMSAISYEVDYVGGQFKGVYKNGTTRANFTITIEADGTRTYQVQ